MSVLPIRAGSDVLLVEREVVIETLADRAQDAHRFARDLGADAVAGEDGDVQFHSAVS
jgi:hypothetical protein